MAECFGYVRETTRVLHGRTAFTGAGPRCDRHLQGCYADLDALASSLAAARRGGEAM